jgi:uncharacterized damage-inducible protein DinB
MAIADALLPEFDHETATTRKVLERVPDGRFDWKPHAKSMSLGQLAGHLATLLTWGHTTLTQPQFDLAGDFHMPPMTTRADLLAVFDKTTAEARAALVGRNDAEMMAPWTLKQGDKTLFTMPKAAVLRTFVMNHMIHHRAQLGVYLRLNDIPLPSVYGPSADEHA